MSSLKEVRDGLKTRLATISGLRVYDTVAGSINPPSAVIIPAAGRPTETMGNDSSELDFDVLLLVSKSVDRTAQDLLDGYLDVSGAGTIVQAIDEDEELGGLAFYTHVKEWGDYGLLEYAGTSYFGARVRVTVGLA